MDAPIGTRSRAGRVLWCLTVALLAACTTWGVRAEPPEDIFLDGKVSLVRVTLADHSVVVLRSPRIARDTLWGLREQPLASAARRPGAAPPGMTPPGGRLSLEAQAHVGVPLADVRTIEVREVDGVRTTVLVVGLGLTALIIAALASDPLGDWGSGGGGGGTSTGWGESSCPLVYSWDGTEWRLDSGTFGGAIVRALARTDVDDLEHAAADAAGVLRLKVADELRETDYVDALHVLAVDHAPGVEIVPDGDGRLHAIGEAAPPSRATDFAGRDALARVVERDGWHWESVPSDRDPARDADVRDGLVLEFPRAAGATEAHLVVDGNNTMWAALLMKEFVEAHGTGTQAWYDSLNAAPERAQALAHKIAGEAFLSVSVWADGDWRTQGLIWEAGPEVQKRQTVALDLTDVEGDVVRVRLESVPLFWAIDRVALAVGPDRDFRMHEIAVARAVDRQGRDVRDLISAIDGAEYVMETGDAAELEFNVPAVPTGRARSYLLESTGWYRIHTDETGDPDRVTLTRALGEPLGISRAAVARLNEALRAMREAE